MNILDFDLELLSNKNKIRKDDILNDSNKNELNLTKIKNDLLNISNDLLNNDLLNIQENISNMKNILTDLEFKKYDIDIIDFLKLFITIFKYVENKKKENLVINKECNKLINDIINIVCHNTNNDLKKINIKNIERKGIEKYFIIKN